jgi:hypothetical protein
MSVCVHIGLCIQQVCSGGISHSCKFRNLRHASFNLENPSDTGDKRNAYAYKVLIRKPERKGKLGRPRCRQWDSIETSHKEGVD